MKSIILRTMTTYLLPLLLLFSMFLLFRGHNQPGGGFVGGLVAAAAFSLYLIAYGIEGVRNVLRVEPVRLIAIGLLIAVSSALFPVLLGKAFMTGTWYEEYLPIVGKMGTPAAFDIGVYFTVLGVTLNIIFSLAEDKD